MAWVAKGSGRQGRQAARRGNVASIGAGAEKAGAGVEEDRGREGEGGHLLRSSVGEVLFRSVGACPFVAPHGTRRDFHVVFFFFIFFYFTS